jgi:4-amino-4-deoxy-L-arabinose transferase-like glycosyltransferase
MTRRTRRDLVWLTAGALVVRLLVAGIVDGAPWTDSAYYFASGQQIATGHGLTVPFIWSFLDTGGRLPIHPTLPIPSHAHWMPLTAFVASLGMWVLGPTELAARLPMIILSTALTPLTYFMALSIWHSRSAAVAGAILIVFAGPLLLFGSIVESYAVFGLAGSAALFSAMLSVADDSRRRTWLILSGAMVGVATLTRIDGVLLAVAPASAWLISMGWTGWHTRGSRPGWTAGIGSAAAFALVVSPWAARNLATFGSILPSTGGSTLWIKSYNEQFSITADTSLGAYLAQGAGPIIGSKAGVWLTIGGYTIALMAGVFGILFLASLWLHRRRADVAPFTIYWLTMFVVMGGVFTFHAPHGLFYHHAAAWLPIAAPMGATAVAPVATAASRWWRFLGRPATHRFLLVASLAAAVAFSIVASGLLLGEWRTNLAATDSVAVFLEKHAAPQDRVMFRDAPLLYIATGHEVVAPTFDPYPIVGQIARAYRIRWFVAQLQARGPLVEPQGLWKGGNAVDAQGNRADWLARVPAYDDGHVRIYEVLPAAREPVSYSAGILVGAGATRT